MWVKICANTSLEDAQRAVELGADAVGFVFAPSTRRVTPEAAGAITAQLRGGAERVGVFGRTAFEAVRAAVREAGLTGVQLHGGDEEELAQRIREEFGGDMIITQTLHWGGDAAGMAGRVKALRTGGIVNRVLVDSKVGVALGGTGQVFDWEAAEEVFAGAEGMPMIVAGGLRQENVAEAVGRLRPWGVDVASGVEAEPGRKDWERLWTFLGEARTAAIAI